MRGAVCAFLAARKVLFQSKFPGRPDRPAESFSQPFLIKLFHPLNHLVQSHGDHAENEDGGDHHIQLEQAGCGGEKIG